MEHDTTIFLALGKGNKEAEKLLYTFVYQRLKEIARTQKQQHPSLSNHDDGSHENTTALVHEAYIKMTRLPPENIANKRDFYLSVATLVNQVLSDISRKQTAQKRDKTSYSTNDFDLKDDELSLLETNLTIEKLLVTLEKNYTRQVEVFKLKQLVGLSVKELTHFYNCSESLIEKDLNFVRRWLKSKLNTNRFTSNPS